MKSILFLFIVLILSPQAKMNVSYNLENIYDFDDETHRLIFSPYDNMLLLIKDDSSIDVMDLKKNIKVKTIETDHRRVMQAALSPDQRFLATSYDEDIEIRSFENGKLIQEFEDDEDVTALVFSLDEKKIATGNSDGVVKVWSVKFGKQLMEFKGHDDDIRSLFFSPDGNYLFSASEDKTIRQWNLLSKKEKRTIITTSGKWDELIGVSMSPQYVVTALTQVRKDTSNRRAMAGPPIWKYLLKISDATTAEELVELDKHKAPITSLDISANQKIIVSGSEDQTVRIWDAQRGTLLSTIPLDEKVRSVAISPDNRWLVASTQDNKVSSYQLSIQQGNQASLADASGGSRKAKKAKNSQIFAVIIGISKYKSDKVTPLEYASRDAQKLYEHLVSKEGMNIPLENIKLILNEEATLLNLKMSLGVFLATKPKKSDTVLIFYAGHGAPETDITGASDDGIAKYIVNYDADPDLLYATAFPMSEIKNIFSRIQSERVAFFIDSCYSGAAGGRSFITSSLKSRALRISRKFLDNNVPDGSGRVIITASRPNERSFELDAFKHGLFSYYLIDGLKGSADMNRNKNITLHEIFTYLEERVASKAQEIGGAQHPMMIGTFQGNLIDLR
ncbi:MAG: caspase family protein [Campylobacterota bacterium]|nr:caspase family protein [Campylobacterota bacterium]